MIWTVLIPDNPRVTFTIPDKYIGREVEVLVFASDEIVASVAPSVKKVTFDSISLDTSGFKFNRDEANLN
jgi:hypothetical protein